MAVKFSDNSWGVRVKDGPRRVAKHDKLSLLCGDGRYGIRIKSPTGKHHWQLVRRPKNVCQLATNTQLKIAGADQVALREEWDKAGKRRRKTMRRIYGLGRNGPSMVRI